MSFKRFVTISDIKVKQICVLTNLTACPFVLPNLTAFHSVLPNLTACHSVLPNLTACHSVLPNLTACHSVNIAPYLKLLIPNQLPPIRINFSGSEYLSNLTVSRVFYSVSTECRIVKLKEVRLPSRNIIMVIPGIVKTGQIFQILERNEHTNRGTPAPWRYQFLYFRNLFFP